MDGMVTEGNRKESMTTITNNSQASLGGGLSLAL